MKFFLAALMFALAFAKLEAQNDSPQIWWTFNKLTNGKIENQNQEYSAELEIQNVKLVPGHKGNAILFKGKGSCAWSSKLSQVMALSENKTWTISFWMKPEAIEHRKKHEIISKGKDKGPGWRLYLSYGMLTFRVGGVKNKNISPAIMHTSENKIKFIPNKWYHICIIKNKDGIVTIYTNGMEMTKSDKAINIYPDYKANFYFGNMLGQYYQYEGLIDEFKFYEKALTPIDVLKEANTENMLFENL